MMFNRFRLAFAHLFIDFKMLLISSVIELQKMHVPMPMHVTLAINDVKYVVIVYWIVVAMKNPIGFFVLNGNLK